MRGRHAKRRPCRIEARPLRDIANRVEHYRCIWAQSFDRPDDYLIEMKKHGRRNKKIT